MAMALCSPPWHRAFQPDAVLHGAQGVNAFCICAGDVRHNGAGTCSDHKLIVGLLPAFAAVQITDGHRLCSAVDAGHFMMDKGGHAALVGHLIHVQAHQVVRLVNDAAHEVRQAAGSRS